MIHFHTQHGHLSFYASDDDQRFILDLCRDDSPVFSYDLTPSQVAEILYTVAGDVYTLEGYALGTLCIKRGPEKITLFDNRSERTWQITPEDALEWAEYWEGL